MRLPLKPVCPKTGDINQMDYTCNAKSCPYDGEGSYVLSLPPEACIDENNCAMVFCPYCQTQMVITHKTIAENPMD